jgi:hypothetical protein
MITIADIQQYKPISTYATNILNYEKEAIQFDLMPLLGAAFWHDIETNPLTTANALLLNGGTYMVNGDTIPFSGLKAVLVYFSYARYVAQNNIQDTPSGQHRLQSDWTVPPSVKEMQLKIDQIKSGAVAYWNQCEAFLNENQANYPLWKKCRQNSKTTSQKIFKI